MVFVVHASGVVFEKPVEHIWYFGNKTVFATVTVTINWFEFNDNIITTLVNVINHG